MKTDNDGRAAFGWFETLRIRIAGWVLGKRLWAYYRDWERQFLYATVPETLPKQHPVVIARYRALGAEADWLPELEDEELIDCS